MPPRPVSTARAAAAAWSALRPSAPPASRLLQPEQPSGVAPEDQGAVCGGHVEPPQTLQHRAQAPDPMGVVAPRQNLAWAGERQGEPERGRVEIHRIEVELLQVGTRRTTHVS